MKMVVCEGYFLEKRSEKWEEFDRGEGVDVEWLAEVCWEMRRGG